MYIDVLSCLVLLTILFCNYIFTDQNAGGGFCEGKGRGPAKNLCLRELEERNESNGGGDMHGWTRKYG